MRNAAFLLSVMAIPCSIVLIAKNEEIGGITLIAAICNTITYWPFKKN